MSFFKNVTQVPDDPILHLTIAFTEDQRKQKVNLGVGVYKDLSLKTPRMSAVRVAEERLLEADKPVVYLPIDGDKGFLDELGKLAFGNEWYEANRGRLCRMQALGGTGALRLGADFLHQEVSQQVYLPQPTWSNHINIFRRARFQLAYYSYYDMDTHQLDFEALYSDIKGLNEGDVVLLHAVCHNPSGRDLSEEQWDALAELLASKNLIPFVDCAYQGFDRSLEEDNYAIRRLVQTGLPVVVAYSCSKNFGLYGERVGALFVVTKDEEEQAAVQKVLKSIARSTYSNPPRHGVAIVQTILSDPELEKIWRAELDQYRERLIWTRDTFVARLMDSGTQRDYSHMKTGAGMFLFTGMKKGEVARIIDEYGIYMTSNGRINLCGLNEDNMDYVIGAMQVVEGTE